MKIVSWNVNGLRACGQKGFCEWLAATDADVVGVQEVRARPEQLPDELAAPAGWHAAFNPAEKLGYSGVGLYSRRVPDSIETSLGVPELDGEGRLQIARYGALTVVNGYFPNGNGTTLPGGKRTNDRIPFKLAFYRAVYDRLEVAKRAGEPIVVMGDFNTAHREIDLARPKANVGTSGFTPIERQEVDRWLKGGWVDAFRRFHEGEPDHYTWWSQRFGVRAKNIGWRIDFVLVSPGALPFLRGASIHKDVTGSDHCPVSIELDTEVLGAR